MVPIYSNNIVGFAVDPLAEPMVTGAIVQDT
jgi:hypothetical protein